MTLQTRPIEDRAIETAAADKLGREPFVENLIRSLVDDVRDDNGLFIGRRASGLTIGLTGRWGLGKSSVLNLVAEKLAETKHVAVAVINPWLFKGRDELLAAFFNQLRDAMGRSGVEHARDLVKALDKYRLAIDVTAHAVTLAADAHGGLGLISTGGNWVRSNLKKLKPFKARLPQEERRSLEAKLQKSKLAVVVLIDELDRVEDDDVRSVAQLVKAVGDIKGISYLVAYDPKRVADALGRGRGKERRQTGEAYLEKIIQHPIPLRPMFESDVDALLDGLFRAHGIDLDKHGDEHHQAVLQQIRMEVRTPRELKRFVGVFASIERMVRGEIRTADVLGYCWIMSKAPGLREQIATDFDRVVNDPSHIEISRRIRDKTDDKRADPIAELGPNAEDHVGMLKLLFPRFDTGPRSSNADRIDNGDRIFLRRNLVRLLYLGDPPGIASLAQLQRIYDIGNADEIAKHLDGLLRVGELAPVIDRLGDFFPRLPASGDKAFWLALAKTLYRQNEWSPEPDGRASVADDAITYLLRLGRHDPSLVERIKAIVSVLEEAGDLILLPRFLRRHLFAFGLTKEQRPATSELLVLSRDETIALLARQLPVFVAALRDGTVLKHIPNADLLFAVKNVDAWVPDLRTEFTEQLHVPEARAAFAAMVVPPGYSVDRVTLDELFDADAVLQWMSEAREGEASQRNWLDGCLARLRYILEGKDDFGD